MNETTKPLTSHGIIFVPSHLKNLIIKVGQKYINSVIG
jgi:hypothetical protein